MTTPNIPVSVPVFDVIVDDVNFVQAIDPNVPNAELTALATMVGMVGDVQGKSRDLLDGLVNMVPMTMSLAYKDTATITVNAGRIWCQNAGATIRVLRKNTANVDITSANLDAGGPNFAVSTQYYIYAIADAVSTTVTFLISTSASAPTGATIFAKVGQFLTNASGNITTVLDNQVLSSGMKKVQSGTVTAQSSFNIANLCPGAKYKLVFNMTQNTTAGYYNLQFNGDGGANYEYQHSYVGGWGSDANTSILLPAASETVLITTPLLLEMLIQSFGNTVGVNGILGLKGTGSGRVASVCYGKYSGAAGLTSLTIATSAGTMTGTWELYQLL